MKKWLHTALLIGAVLALWGCANPAPEKDSTPQTTYEEPTVQTESAPEETTAPTHPTTAGLGLPRYTAQEVLVYFREVVLDIEYSDGLGDSALVQKWTSPILYRIYGTPTEEDRAVLAALFAELNGIPGFPGIHGAEDGNPENLSISFLEPEEFRASFSDVVGGEEANGAAQFWYYIATNEIHTARIGYRTDVAQSLRNSILVEEMINTLGISDTVLRSDSVVYQYSDENTALSDVDRVILRLLYDPAIQCGMDEEACAGVITELYE